MTDRPSVEIRSFLVASGFDDPSITPVAADWSARRFYRVAQRDDRAILMVCPDGTVDRLQGIARLFEAHGVMVPRVRGVDKTAGLVLVEDFGEQTMGEQIDTGAAAAPMFESAVDLLIHLHKAYPARLFDAPPRFTAAEATHRAARYCDDYLPSVGVSPSVSARARFVALWQATWPAAESIPVTLAHYDFHPGNLFWRPRGPEGAPCGVIDFQDAVLAPVAFDLACLIQDVRRDYRPTLRDGLMARYLAAFPRLEPDSMVQAIAVIGAQRASQILGNLGRARRERRLTDRQQGDMGRAGRWLQTNLIHPVNAGIRSWYDDHAPPAVPR